jgi:ketosteroid isomerase-like protein
VTSDLNTQVVLDGFEAFVEGRFDVIAQLWDRDCLMTAPEGWPERGPFVGRDAVYDQIQRLRADFDRHQFDVGSVTTEGDWVVVEFEWIVRGAASGVETQFDMVGAFRVEDGRMKELHYRWTRADALEAAGVSEQAGLD